MPNIEKISVPYDMVIFPDCVFGEMIFIKDGLKTLINRDFKILADFRISQKYNPKIPQNDTFSFLGSVDIRMTREARHPLSGKTAGCSWMGGFARMRKKNFKGRCEKRMIGKCSEVCRTYDAIQYAYADLLQVSDEVKEIRCNILLDGLDVGEYTSDFVCTKTDGDLMVRECVFRKFLMKPLTVKLLDASREYWIRHGVTDWGLVIDEEA